MEDDSSTSSEDPQESSTSARPLRTGAKRICLTLNAEVDLEFVTTALKEVDCVVLYLNVYRSFIQKYPFRKISAAFFYARLPHLLGIKVECPENKANRPENPSSTFGFPVKALASVLRKATQLEYLIFDVKLAGTRADFADFGRAVGRMQAIQCVGFTINIEELPSQEESPSVEKQENLLDPLVHSLSQKTTLTDVIIKSGVRHQLEACLGGLRSDSLQALCRLPKLTCMYLFLFVLSDDNISALAKALENNTLLTEICINCSIGTSGSQALSRMLRRNTSLEEMIFIIKSYASNASMELVNQEIAKGVASSSSLQEFLFQGGHDLITTKSLELFRNVVHTNYVLEKVCLRVQPSQAHQDLENEMQFYLDLNKTGRGKLLQDDTVFRDERWIQMLARSSQNLAQLYYFLSMNPALIHNSTIVTANHKRSSSAAKYSRKRKRLYRAAKYKGVSYS